MFPHYITGPTQREEILRETQREEILREILIIFRGGGFKFY